MSLSSVTLYAGGRKCTSPTLSFSCLVYLWTCAKQWLNYLSEHVHQWTDVSIFIIRWGFLRWKRGANPESSRANKRHHGSMLSCARGLPPERSRRKERQEEMKAQSQICLPSMPHCVVSFWKTVEFCCYNGLSAKENLKKIYRHLYNWV